MSHRHDDVPACPICGVDPDAGKLADHIDRQHETGVELAEEVIGNVPK